MAHPASIRRNVDLDGFCYDEETGRVYYRLSFSEMLGVAMVGVTRRVMDRSGVPKVEPYGSPRNPWDCDIEGAAAEYVVSRYRGHHWDGSLGNLNAADAGQGVQVRSTTHRNGCLLLHKRDADDDVFVLVVTNSPHYTIIGWCFGYEGKREEFFQEKVQNGRPCYFVPQSVLHKPAELLERWGVGLSPDAPSA